MRIETTVRAVTLLLLALASREIAAASDIADALMRGDTGQAAALIAGGAEVDAVQPDGTAPLHWAAYQNDPATVRLLLDAGADPELATHTGMTPLLLATEAGNAEIAALLVAAGADVNAGFTHGETPLMMAARTGDTATIDALVAAGADVDARENLRGTTALMWAAAYANPQAVARLIEHGADFAAKSATIGAGRNPYLAPTARSRISQFVRGTGSRGGDLNPEDASLAALASADNPAPGDTGNIEAARAAARQAAEAQLAAHGGLSDPDDPFAEGADQAERLQNDNADNSGLEQENGGLTALIFAAREGDPESTRILIEAGADVNQTSEYGWTPLLAAIQNRYYELAMYLLDHGADPNIATHGGWNPLYIATDNRNIEGGDYPTRKPDLDHLTLIKRLLEEGADPNQRMASSTETRTIFTHQWLREEGATPLLRAAQSGDLELIELLLEYGADPNIPTEHDVTPLMVASGIAWVEGVTFEWSREQTLEVMQRLIELGADVNAQDTEDYRTALMGAAHKGHTEGVQLLVDNGADLSLRDIGSRDSIYNLAGVTWQAVDYAEGLVRVGVQSAVARPETAALIRRLMREQGLEVPPEGRTLDSICVVDICR